MSLVSESLNNSEPTLVSIILSRQVVITGCLGTRSGMMMMISGEGLLIDGRPDSNPGSIFFGTSVRFKHVSHTCLAPIKSFLIQT